MRKLELEKLEKNEIPSNCSSIYYVHFNLKIVFTFYADYMQKLDIFSVFLSSSSVYLYSTKDIVDVDYI